MQAAMSFWKSSIGKKIIMAVTGAFLIFFVIGHMLGNLQIFLGPETLNGYAQKLVSLGPILWVVRIVFLTMFVVHIIASIQLTVENYIARPDRYQYDNTVQATLASRTMIYTGSLVLIFVLIHLVHFTFGMLQPDYFHLEDPKGLHDVYSMVVHGFQNPVYSVFYIVLMVVLGYHLSHAFASACETLGWNNQKYYPIIHQAGTIASWVIAAGYILIPLAVLSGVIGLPNAGS